MALYVPVHSADVGIVFITGEIDQFDGIEVDATGQLFPLPQGLLVQNPRVDGMGIRPTGTGTRLVTVCVIIANR